MNQTNKRISFDVLLKAIDKKRLTLSVALCAIGAMLFPSPELYDTPLTLSILHAWLLAIIVTGMGFFGLVKVVVGADFNK